MNGKRGGSASACCCITPLEELDRCRLIAKMTLDEVAGCIWRAGVYTKLTAQAFFSNGTFYLLYYKCRCVKFVREASRLAENCFFLFLSFAGSDSVSLQEQYVLCGLYALTDLPTFFLLRMCSKHDEHNVLSNCGDLSFLATAYVTYSSPWHCSTFFLFPFCMV